MNVSVIIPSFNGKKLLEKYLPSVQQSLDEDDEIIVVDDCSSDGTAEYLKNRYPSIKVVQNTPNKRFAYSCNQGVKEAKKEYCVLLNNDVQPTAGFLSPLIDHLKKSDQIFAIGCLEKNIDGKLSGRSGGDFRRGSLVHWRAKDQQQNSTLWTSGGSMAFRKSIWIKLGGMDELFAPAYWEDIDICYRAVKSGYEIGFEPQSLVFHQHETTNKKALGVLALQAAGYKNMFLFFWKNVSTSSLWLSHLFWLPYHLIIGGFRSHGLLTLGFFQACMQLPQLFQHKKQANEKWILSDFEVIEKSR